MESGKKGFFRKENASAIVLIICLLLMVISSAVGHNIQTSGGSVKTENLTFVTDTGATSHAKLYVPETATADNPGTGDPALPWVYGIAGCHGAQCH